MLECATEYTVDVFFLYQMNECRGKALVLRYPALTNTVRSPESCNDNGLMCPFTLEPLASMFLFVLDFFPTLKQARQNHYLSLQGLFSVRMSSL